MFITEARQRRQFRAVIDPVHQRVVITMLRLVGLSGFFQDLPHPNPGETEARIDRQRMLIFSHGFLRMPQARQRLCQILQRPHVPGIQLKRPAKCRGRLVILLLIRQNYPQL